MLLNNIFKMLTLLLNKQIVLLLYNFKEKKNTHIIVDFLATFFLSIIIVGIKTILHLINVVFIPTINVGINI